MAEQMSSTSGAALAGKGVMTDREDRMRERAYQIWEEQGRPEGRDLEHWHEAARQLHEDIDAEVIQERDGTTSKAASVTAKPLTS
jgi:hypothetical protein